MAGWFDWHKDVPDAIIDAKLNQVTPKYARHSAKCVKQRQSKGLRAIPTVYFFKFVPVLTVLHVLHFKKLSLF